MHLQKMRIDLLRGNTDVSERLRQSRRDRISRATRVASSEQIADEGIACQSADGVA